MTGRALCLPSAGEIQQTPTREPTETLSKANRAEGAGLERAAGRGGARAERWRNAGGGRARAPAAGGRGFNCAQWPGLAAWGCGGQGRLYPRLLASLRVPGESLSFIQPPGWGSQG